VSHEAGSRCGLYGLEGAGECREIPEQRRRKVGPLSPWIPFVVKELVEEPLPTTESVEGRPKWELALIDGVGELIKVKHPIVASVRRHHHIDPQVATRDATLFVSNVDQIDVPRVRRRLIVIDAEDHVA
jgi:hypothetical protein